MHEKPFQGKWKRKYLKCQFLFHLEYPFGREGERKEEEEEETIWSEGNCYVIRKRV